MKPLSPVVVIAMLLSLGALPMQAQTIDEMRAALRQMRDELDALKAQKAADARADPRTALATEVPEPAASAPSASTIPGGMLIPGSRTSIRSASA